MKTMKTTKTPMKRSILVAALMAVAVPQLADLAAADEGKPESGLAACGHLDEMQAAREALAAGDREEALVHLRAARAILVECERRAEDRAALPEPALPIGSI